AAAYADARVEGLLHERARARDDRGGVALEFAIRTRDEPVAADGDRERVARFDEHREVDVLVREGRDRRARTEAVRRHARTRGKTAASQRRREPRRDVSNAERARAKRVVLVRGFA